jgi:Tetratricopeptide repeat
MSGDTRNEMSGSAGLVIQGRDINIALPRKQERVRVGVVPRPADCFQARALLSGGQVLTGMGGVGKTQLAASHARRCWAEGVEVLVWATAATRPGIVDAYADAAVKLGVGDREDPERAAAEFLVWAETTPMSWLVVLDDIQDPADVRGLWPPESGTGGLVATTRRRDAALIGADRRLVEVGVFTPAEAGEFLFAKLGEVAGVELARDLGYLPLALAQAAAFILDQDITVDRYRTLLARRLLEQVVPETGALPDDHRRIVTATWDLSAALADIARPAGLARPLLSLISVLDPNGIPAAALSSPPALAYLEASPEAVEEALRVLHRFSLIDHDRDAVHREVRVHRLVQRAIRETHAAQPDTAAGTAYRDLCALAARHLGPDHDDTLTARNNLARWRGEAGDAAGAVAALEELLADRLRVFGPDGAFTTRGNLAYRQGKAGDAAGAAAALEELLADQVRVFGPDHPDTLLTRNNLAGWRAESGDAVGAAAMLEELLAGDLRVLGPDHPLTLSARSNLAFWRGRTGDAAAVFEELLKDCLRVLGPDHPDTLMARTNLAYWRGDDVAARFEEVLADRLRVLGPDHPDTLTTRSNLAYLRER